MKRRDFIKVLLASSALAPLAPIVAKVVDLGAWGNLGLPQASAAYSARSLYGGFVAEVSYFNKALGEHEIKAIRDFNELPIYAADATVARWYDQSGNGNHMAGDFLALPEMRRA